MILVAGGTGRLGRVLVQGLRQGGVPVRVLTRSPDTATRLRAEGVDCVVGDIRMMEDASRAVSGCTVVISAVSGFGRMGTSTPENVDRDGNLNLIRAASNAGVGHIILVSMHGASEDARLPLLRMKHAAEQALRDSGVPWTIIRPTACLETYLDAMGESLATKGNTVVFGSGTVEMNFVSVLDVAAVIRYAIDEPELRGQHIDWGGTNLTLNEISDALHTAAGTPGKTKRIPLLALRMMAVAARPFDPFLARVAQAAVLMNTTNITFDAGPERERVPGLPWTTLAEAATSR